MLDDTFDPVAALKERSIDDWYELYENDQISIEQYDALLATWSADQTVAKLYDVAVIDEAPFIAQLRNEMLFGVSDDWQTLALEKTADGVFRPEPNTTYTFNGTIERVNQLLAESELRREILSIGTPLSIINGQEDEPLRPRCDDMPEWLKPYAK